MRTTRSQTGMTVLPGHRHGSFIHYYYSLGMIRIILFYILLSLFSLEVITNRNEVIFCIPYGA